MKKLVVVLTIVICTVSSVMAQITINYEKRSTEESNYGELVRGQFKCDSLYFQSPKRMAAYDKDGNFLSADYVTSIEAPATMENIRRLEEIGNYQSGILKRKCRNAAIGNFVVGTTLIFISNIAADAYYDSKIDNIDVLSKNYNNELKNIRTGTKAIRYVGTGVGAIFEIIGFVKVAQLADGSKFSYGISNDGVTVSYKFR